MKIYFFVDSQTSGFPVHYLDEVGCEIVANLQSADPGEAVREFKAARKNAVYTDKLQFERLKLRMAADRAKLLAWKEWTV